MKNTSSNQKIKNHYNKRRAYMRLIRDSVRRDPWAETRGKNVQNTLQLWEWEMEKMKTKFEKSNRGKRKWIPNITKEKWEINLQFRGKNEEVEDDFLGQNHSEKWSFRGKNREVEDDFLGLKRERVELEFLGPKDM